MPCGQPNPAPPSRPGSSPNTAGWPPRKAGASGHAQLTGGSGPWLSHLAPFVFLSWGACLSAAQKPGLPQIPFLSTATQTNLVNSLAKLSTSLALLACRLLRSGPRTRPEREAAVPFPVTPLHTSVPPVVTPMGGLLLLRLGGGEAGPWGWQRVEVSPVTGG